MSRKDYVKLAAALNEQLKWARENAQTVIGMGVRGAQEACGVVKGLEQAVYAIERVLTNDNPAFDSARFRKACGVEA